MVPSPFIKSDQTRIGQCVDVVANGHLSPDLRFAEEDAEVLGPCGGGDGDAVSEERGLERPACAEAGEEEGFV